MTRNPDWTRDELILALELFIRSGHKQLKASHPDVVELSKQLNQLPIHDHVLRNSDFRNPKGVSMKLGNFLSIDPSYVGIGLQRGGKQDREVWDEFANNIYKLYQTADSIRKSAAQITESSTDYSFDSEDEEFPEGKLLTQIHKRKERNRKAVEQKKQKVLEETGKLVCEVCEFDFAERYGPLGYGYAECHHTIPVFQLTEEHRTRLADLAIVCANCHRMIHHSRPMLSITELRVLVEQHNPKA
ncbi:MAG: HNH endonuclease [Chloroflexi bacterium]|nr:HNH endonuclease [Chloroflexota bacterium]